MMVLRIRKVSLKITLYGFLVVLRQALKCTPEYTLKKPKNKPGFIYS